MSCSNNLKQIGVGEANYELSHKELPPARPGPDATTSKEVLFVGRPAGPSAGGGKGYERSGTSSFVLMLPFMEDQALYDQFDIDHGDGIWISTAFSVDWHTAAKDKAIATRPGFVVCPSSLTLPQTELPDYQEDKANVPATGTYAFCGGHRGINKFGVDACLVKHHNTGMHLSGHASSSRKSRMARAKQFLLAKSSTGTRREARTCGPMPYGLPIAIE